MMKVTQLANLGSLSVDRIEIPPGHIKTPVVHYECQEVLFVLEGRLNILVGGEWKIIGAGDTVGIPIGTVHASRNESPDVVVLLAANSPAYHESFEHDVAE
jgi:mannose-6-phosphate isomerase-like protein (cupin superfamily)